MELNRSVETRWRIKTKFTFNLRKVQRACRMTKMSNLEWGMADGKLTKGHCKIILQTYKNIPKLNFTCIWINLPR